MSTKSYTIFRVAKLATAKRAGAASDHNYRKCEVPNADERAPHPSPEFLNPAELGYWELAQERLDEAGITPRRKDAVRCVEIVLAASPEWFQRDKGGRATDYSNHDWTKDNLTYLQKTFGTKNVLAFKLHQDEKSPHIHALIVPITPDNRLSGRDVVGRPALRQLQTSYAKAMAAHGLERGVERSQAKHKPMKQFYGQQIQASQQAGKLLASVELTPVKVDRPKPSDAFSLDKWVEDQSKKVNKHFQPLLDALAQRADVATNLALENASAKDQVRVLQKELHTSQELKQKAGRRVGELTQEVATLQRELAAARQEVEQARRDRERFAVATYEGRPVTELVNQGNTMFYVREVERLTVLQPAVQAALDRQQFDTVSDYFRQVAGYSYHAGPDGQPGRMRQQEHPHFTFTLTEARAEGTAPLLQTIEQDILERERRRVQAEQERVQVEQERQARVEKELVLMQRAFEIHRPNSAGQLQMCLLVPDQHAQRILDILRTPDAGAYALRPVRQADSPRYEGLTPFYTIYYPYPETAKMMTTAMEHVRELGGNSFERAGHKAGREQAARGIKQVFTVQHEQPKESDQSYGIN